MTNTSDPSNTYDDNMTRLQIGQHVINISMLFRPGDEIVCEPRTTDVHRTNDDATKQIVNNNPINSIEAIKHLPNDLYLCVLLVIIVSP